MADDIRMEDLSAFNVGKAEQMRMARELKSLAQDITDLASDKLDIYKKITPFERQMVAAAQKSGNFSKAQLSGLQAYLGELQKRITAEDRIQQIMEENRSLVQGWVDKIQEGYLRFKAIAQDPMVATALLSAAVLNDLRRWAVNVDKVQQTLGMAGQQTWDMAKAVGAASLSGIVLGYGLDEAAEAAQGLVQASGDLAYVNRQNVREVAQMASWYGVSADVAAKLQVMSAQIGDNTLKTYRDMANLAGVMPGRVMADMAENAEFFAKYAKDGGTNIAEAAIAAQQLGLTLAEVEGISSNILDVQSSLENEMQASVLLGRQLNLNRARELAMAGDHAAMMQEITQQLGDQAAWEQMNVIQREAFAGALGLSVSQMQQIIAQQDEINNQAAMQETLWGKIQLAIRSVGKGAMNFKETLLASGNFLFAMSHNMRALGGIANAVGGPFRRLSASIGGLFKSTPGAAAGAPALEKGTQAMSRSMGGLGRNMGNIMKGAAAMVLMAGALWILGKAMQEIQKVENVWQQLAVAGVALLGFSVILAAVGAIMMSGVGAVAILAGAGAFVMMAGALWILGKALQQVSPPMESITAQLAVLSEYASVMPMIGAGFASMGLGLLGLAGGLMAVTPFLPVLAAVTALAGRRAGAVGGAEVAGGTNAEVLEELRAIRLLIEQGADIRLGENKVGTWLGRNQSVINALE